jgi:predicted transcriptional regulator of viral defense system
MEIKGRPLGPLEAHFFAWAQSRKKREVKTGDLVVAFNFTAKQEASLLYNLARKGLILKLWRGYYLVPKQLPPGGKWNPSPYLIVNKYMEQLGANYQISGPAVFNSYGFSNQLSSEFLIYNDRVSQEVRILQYRFIFVKVKSERLGETQVFFPHDETEDGRAIFSSIEKMLLDAVYDYKRFGTLPEAYSWINDALKNEKINSKKFARVVSKFGNTMSKKRIGWLLEKLGVEKTILQQIKKSTPKSKFLVPLNPNNYNGPINKTWGVIENVKIPA